jgi:hypothetical protein
MTGFPAGRTSGFRASIRPSHGWGSPLAVSSARIASDEPANDVIARRAMPPSPSAAQHQNGVSISCTARGVGGSHTPTASFAATPIGRSRSAAVSRAGSPGWNRMPS